MYTWKSYSNVPQLPLGCDIMKIAKRFGESLIPRLAREGKDAMGSGW